MLRSDFDYELPSALIAQHPLEHRGESRMLRVEGNYLADGRITEFPEHLGEGDLVVFNDTKVIPARLRGIKSTGGAVEILVERITGKCTALAHVRASKPLRPGGIVMVNGAALVMERRVGDLFTLKLHNGAGDFEELLSRAGETPLPPYIGHKPDAIDAERYQTVFARVPGAVAAPTAGLHFDKFLLDRLVDRGVDLGYITLHVGAGSFQPMREPVIEQHHMHPEWFTVSPALTAKVACARSRGGRVVAVGTTVVRALESATDERNVLRPVTDETRLFISPGFRFRTVDALLTNFHLPQSTLLMLVCAFSGYGRVMAAYRHAVAQGYRFFSYGDAMWFPQRHADREPR